MISTVTDSVDLFPVATRSRLLPGILFPTCPLQQSDPQKKQRMKAREKPHNHNLLLSRMFLMVAEFALAFFGLIKVR